MAAVMKLFRPLPAARRFGLPPLAVWFSLTALHCSFAPGYGDIAFRGGDGEDSNDSQLEQPAVEPALDSGSEDEVAADEFSDDTTITTEEGADDESQGETEAEYLNPVCAEMGLSLWTALIAALGSEPTALEPLTELHLIAATNEQFLDIQGTSCLPNLETLELASFGGVDLGPLEQLPALRTLVIRFLFSAGDTLPSLPNLESLTATDYTFFDVDSLAGKDFSSLLYLDLNDNFLSNLTGLEYFTTLETLNLSENEISNLDPLSNLLLLRALNLSQNSGLQDLAPLANLTNLEYLDLPQTAVTDLSPLEDLSNLIALDLSLLDTPPGTNLPTWAQTLSALTALRTLQLNSDQISNGDIGTIATLNQLADLQLANNDFDSIADLSTMTHLQNLNIAGNSLASLAATATVLAALPDLRGVDLGATGWQDLSLLDPLVQAQTSEHHLESLAVNSNGISDISAVADFQFLANFFAADNQISNVDALEDLDSLRVVDLRHNPLADLEGLVMNAGFTTLGSEHHLYLTASTTINPDNLQVVALRDIALVNIHWDP